MKTIYVVIWHEAIEAGDLIAGVFTEQEKANSLCEKLIAESSGDYWEVVETELDTLTLDEQKEQSEQEGDYYSRNR